MIVRNFNLHLNAGVSAPLVINVNQYDHYEQWVFTLYTEKGELFTPDTGAIIGVKSDGRAITNDATVNEDGQIVVSETEQMTAAPGKAMFELTINGGMHGTANFYLNVEPKPGENAVLSDSDLGLIQEAVEAAADIHGAAELMDEVTTLNRRVENLITTSAKTQEYVAPLSNSNWTVSGGKYTYSDYISFSEPVGNAKVIDAGWNVSSSGRPTEWRYEGVSAGYDGTDVYYTIVTDTDPRSDETTCYFRFVLWFPAETLGGTANEVVDIRVPASGMTVPTGGYSSAGDAVRGQILELKSQIAQSAGLTYDIKQALMNLANHVVWDDDDPTGQTYIDDLYDALYPPVEIDSITASFTQSGTIYDIADLDDLKTDLVVTANYSDGTHGSVSQYTLSGTLEAGTSTITVSYQEKATSFDVTVTASLPSGYTKYDYLYQTASGSKAQNYMINLATYPNLNRISLDMKVKVLSVLGGYAIIGGRSESGYAYSLAFYANNGYTNGSLSYHIHGVESGTTAGHNIPFDINAVHSLKYTATTESPSVIEVDGKTYETEWVNDNVINRHLTLLSNTVGKNNQRLSENIQIGRVIVKDENGDVLNRYVPCVQDSSNKIGMYDIDNQVFYTPSKSGVAVIGNSACIYQVGNWS